MAALPTLLRLEVVGGLSNAPIGALRLALFPTHFSHGINANLLILEHQDGFAECLRVFHEPTVLENGGLVKYIYAVSEGVRLQNPLRKVVGRRFVGIKGLARLFRYWEGSGTLSWRKVRFCRFLIPFLLCARSK
jgi:hypothetical protein